MFADFVARLRAARGGPADAGVAPLARGEQERSLPFRGYLLWLTFPPMILLWLDRPFGLVVAYGVLGAFFMPFLAATLLWAAQQRAHAPRMAQRSGQQRPAGGLLRALRRAVRAAGPRPALVTRPAGAPRTFPPRGWRAGWGG